MNVSQRRTVAGFAIAMLMAACGTGWGQTAGSAGSGGTAAWGWPGQPRTIAARAMPGGALQIAVGPGGPAFGMPDAQEVVRNEPYEAEAVTEIRQTLADGTHIHQTIAADVARDAAGRTMRSQRLGIDGPFLAFRIAGDPSSAVSDTQPPVLTTIFDPVAKEHIDYTSDVRVARVMPLGGAMEIQGFSASGPSGDGPVTRVVGPPAGGVMISGGDDLPVVMAGGGPAAEKVESLGKRTIEGVEVMGTRRIRTIPRGAIGNDRPLVTTEDTWYSPKLRLVVLSVRDDPRFGETTYSLTKLKLTNPDESRFEIPPGYAVEPLAPPENPMPAPPR